MLFFIKILLFITSSLCQTTNMQAYMDQIEQRVMDLASKFESDYALRCSAPCSPSFDGCSTQMPMFYCATEFTLTSCSCYSPGYPINVTSSVVKLAKFPSSNDSNYQGVMEMVCASSHIDDDFIQLRQDIPSVKWNYMGSYNGMMRSYPGKNYCRNYDPRTRPWYVAAASGFVRKFFEKN